MFLMTGGSVIFFLGIPILAGVYLSSLFAMARSEIIDVPRVNG